MKLNNIFKIETIKIEGGYIKVTGKYLMTKSVLFKKGDILTEDKYNGHDIHVAFAYKDENGKICLTLDTKSIQPNPLIVGLNLFKIKD